MSTINIINSYLAYQDPQVIDNPQIRAFDISRKINSVNISNPTSDSKVVAPGASLVLFDGTTATLLDNSSVLGIALLPGQQSLYRITVSAGNSGFRTPRTISGLGSVSVAINNNVLATFDFGGASISGVQVGDVLRISGQATYDTGPFAFNPLNAGLWSVVGVSGSVLSCVRAGNAPFMGVAETVSASGSDVQVYSSSGVQEGSKVRISGTFSPASQRTYAVQAVTPTTFDIMSSVGLPVESGLSYQTGSIVFYTNSKRFCYIEVDQDGIIRYNGDTGSSNVINPIVPGDKTLKGFSSKWGETWTMSVQNTSVNPMNLQFYLAE